MPPTGVILPEAVGNTLCAPLPVNACTAFGLLPAIDVFGPLSVCDVQGVPSPTCNSPNVVPNKPQSPADLLCVPLPENPCTLLGPPCAAPPLNNCFGTPTLVPASPFNMTQDMSFGSIQEGEPTKCKAYWDSGSVWYRWTPTGNTKGKAQVSALYYSNTLVVDDVEGNAPNWATVAVYTGSTLASLKQVACNFSAPNINAEGPAKFTCVPGTTYQIQVLANTGGYFGLPVAGQADLSISGCQGPATIDSTPVARSLLPCLRPPVGVCLASFVPAAQPVTMPAFAWPQSPNSLVKSILALGGL